MKKLLVIADKSGGNNSALSRAAILQRRTGAKIVLLGFCYADINNLQDENNKKYSRSSLEKKLIAKKKNELEHLIKTKKLDPTLVKAKAMWGKHIAPAIIAFCENNKMDIVFKSGNRSGSFLYTSTDWQLLRECPSPLIITAGKSWKKKTNIVAAVDFATHAKTKIKLNHKIVEHAQLLARALNEEVHLAYSLTIPQPLVDLDIINANKYVKEKRKQLQPVIDAFSEKYDIPLSNIHIKRGEPAKIIPSLANDQKADIVVMGTIGRKGIKGKLIGNTAEAILGRLYTDILAVRL